MRNSLSQFLHSLYFALLVSACMYAYSMPAQAEKSQTFAEWVDYLRVEAKRQGIKQTTIDSAFAYIQERPSKKIVNYDNHQPELMQNFFSYYDRRLNDDFIGRGKANYKKYRTFLNKLEKKYNVPGAYIIALWGMETSYGRVKGSHNIFNATATLSYTRRKNFFTLQFFTALKIMEKYNRSAEQMVGSWASAMGHMQFIPTTLYDYGIDGDGDKKIDVWSNEYDAFATAAHYLYRRGWNADELWGREVKLPKKFNYALANPKKKHKLSYWKKKKVKRIDGKILPTKPNLPAGLVLPAGANGPKFLVYNNFYRLLNWNNSIHNALTVSLLANAISNRPVLQSTYSVGKNALKIEFVKNAQSYLNKLGYHAGTPDGKFGSKSRAALKKYQKSRKLPVDGYLDIIIYKRLLQDVSKK